MNDWPVCECNGYGASAYKRGCSNARAAATQFDSTAFKTHFVKWWGEVWIYLSRTPDFENKYPLSYLSEHLSELPAKLKTKTYFNAFQNSLSSSEYSLLELLEEGRHFDPQRLTCWIAHAIADIILDTVNTVAKRDAAWRLIQENHFAMQVCAEYLSAAPLNEMNKALFRNWMSFCENHIARCVYTREREQFNVEYLAWKNHQNLDAKSPIDRHYAIHWRPIHTSSVSWVFAFLNTDSTFFCELCSQIDHPQLINSLFESNSFYKNTEHIAKIIQAAPVLHAVDNTSIKWAGYSLCIQVLQGAWMQSMRTCELLNKPQNHSSTQAIDLHTDVIAIWQDLFALLLIREDALVLMQTFTLNLLNELAHQSTPLIGFSKAKLDLLTLIVSIFPTMHEFERSKVGDEALSLENALLYFYMSPASRTELTLTDTAMFKLWLKHASGSANTNSVSLWFVSDAILKFENPWHIWGVIWQEFALQRETAYWCRPEFGTNFSEAWLAVGVKAWNASLSASAAENTEVTTFTPKLIAEFKIQYLNSHSHNKNDLVVELVCLLNYHSKTHLSLEPFADEMNDFF